MECEMFGGAEVKKMNRQCTGIFIYMDIESTKNTMGIVMEKVTVSQEERK